LDNGLGVGGLGVKGADGLYSREVNAGVGSAEMSRLQLDPRTQTR
jgi:hypothetical protein